MKLVGKKPVVLSGSQSTWVALSFRHSISIITQPSFAEVMLQFGCLQSDLLLRFAARDNNVRRFAGTSLSAV